MRRIYKYELHMLPEKQAIRMPKNAQVIHFAFQGGTPMLWAVIDTAEKNKEHRYFTIHGTGFCIEPREVHIGTALVDSYVWHCFEG